MRKVNRKKLAGMVSKKEWLDVKENKTNFQLNLSLNVSIAISDSEFDRAPEAVIKEYTYARLLDELAREILDMTDPVVFSTGKAK